MPMYDAIRLLHAESHSCMPYVTRCVVYILTRLSTHLSYTAKLGQKAIALPMRPALLSACCGLVSLVVVCHRKLKQILHSTKQAK